MDIDSGSALKKDDGTRKSIFDDILYQNIGGKFVAVN